MIRIVAIAVAFAVLVVLLSRRRSAERNKVTDKRARADLLKQLLALSEVESAKGQPSNAAKTGPVQPVPAAKPRPTPAKPAKSNSTPPAKEIRSTLAKVERR